MAQSEVALLCQHMQANFEAMRYLLNDPNLEEGHYVLIRSCIGHIASSQERLELLVGSEVANTIFRNVHHYVLRSETCRRGIKRGR